MMSVIVNNTKHALDVQVMDGVTNVMKVISRLMIIKLAVHIIFKKHFFLF